jgi:peptidoglycan hydrolase-like protein with peptidoglycan-binding domain
MNHLAVAISMLVLATAAIPGSALAADERATDKKPGSATERIKQKVLGDTPDREPDPVKAAQRALRNRGYDPGAVDGKLGAKTRTAVKEFQKAEGLEVTGRLDTETMSRLRREGKAGERKDRDTAGGRARLRQRWSG